MSKISKKTKNILFASGIVSLSAVIVGIIIVAIIMFSRLDEYAEKYVHEKYDKSNYYQMEAYLTEDNIRFYVHNNNLYLDNKFKDSVGAIYREGDSDSMYIVYHDKKYPLSDNETKLIEVSPSSN